MKWLRYSSEHFGEIMYKNSLEERAPFCTLRIRRRGSEERKFTVKPITEKPVPINTEKKNDFISLFSLIPAFGHQFYQHMLVSNSVQCP